MFDSKFRPTVEFVVVVFVVLFFPVVVSIGCNLWFIIVYLSVLSCPVLLLLLDFLEIIYTVSGPLFGRMGVLLLPPLRDSIYVD